MKTPFPWYDAVWLNQYVAAKVIIERLRPGLLPRFVESFDRFRTRPDFAVQQIGPVFDETTMAKIKDTIRALRVDKIKTHETSTFGRLIVHNNPYFTELQATLTARISELAGEAVMPCYNFLSLYSKFGVCPVHMDAPTAKWPLDICIEQTDPWPIQFSQIVPWPEDYKYQGDDWQEWIKRSPELTFTAYTLQPNQALLFSGSSQWHYRDPLPPAGNQGSCKLLFFHFVPKDLYELSRPETWARLFDLPELAAIAK